MPQVARQWWSEHEKKVLGTIGEEQDPVRCLYSKGVCTAKQGNCSCCSASQRVASSMLCGALHARQQHCEEEQVESSPRVAGLAACRTVKSQLPTTCRGVEIPHFQSHDLPGPEHLPHAPA